MSEDNKDTTVKLAPAKEPALPVSKKKKYTDAETKKPGSPIETPFKHGDARNKVLKEMNDLAVIEEGEPVIRLKQGELSLENKNE